MSRGQVELGSSPNEECAIRQPEAPSQQHQWGIRMLDGQQQTKEMFSNAHRGWTAVPVLVIDHHLHQPYAWLDAWRLWRLMSHSKHTTHAALHLSRTGCLEQSSRRVHGCRDDGGNPASAPQKGAVRKMAKAESGLAPASHARHLPRSHSLEDSTTHRILQSPPSAYSLHDAAQTTTAASR